VHIANRTPERPSAWRNGHVTQGVRGGGMDTIRGSFDLVLNATSASLAGEMPRLPHDSLTPEAVCYDLFYSDRPRCSCCGPSAKGHAGVRRLGHAGRAGGGSLPTLGGVRPETAELLAAHRI